MIEFNQRFSVVLPHIITSINIARPLIAIDITSTKKDITRPYIGWIDTGATITALSPKIFQDLEFIKDDDKKINVQGVNSAITTEDLYVVKFKIIGTDNTEFEDSISVVKSITEFKDFDLLIGLDILQYAQFWYDANKTPAFGLSFPKPMAHL